MSTPPSPPVADLDMRAPKPPLRQRLSLVWLVPVMALVVSLGIAWKAYSDRGEVIEITFRDATGINVGDTRLKFREVDVGLVEALRFSDDLREVIVSVRVNKDVAPYIDENARFWLVTPEVTARGISRLDTVLSGAFIEGLWDAETGPALPRYTALTSAPAERFAEGGSFVQLRVSDAGAISEGAPVIFRGLEVGALSNLRLDPGGSGALIDAFIESPHDARLTTGTRFWDISGFSVSLSGAGLNLNVRSLAALITGGVEFADIVSGGQPIEAGHSYQLYSSRDAARDGVLLDDQDTNVPVSLLLDGSVRGLQTGAEVQYRGLRVGRVEDFSLVVQDGPRAARDLRLLVNLSLQPARLGLRADTTYAEVLGFLAERVDAGLRGRVGSTGLLGGTVIVELVEMDTLAPGEIDFGHEPFPLLPAAPSELADPSATAEGLLGRLGALPIEELMDAAIRLMNAGTDLVGRETTQLAPDRLVALLDQISALVGSEDVQAIAPQTRAAMTDLGGLLGELRGAALPDQIAQFVASADTAVQAVAQAAEGVPGLLSELEGLARVAGALPLETLTTRASDILATLDGLFGSEETAALPGALADTLGELRAALVELREGGAVESVNAALLAAQEATATVARSTEALPVVLEGLNRVIANVDAAVASYGPRSAFNDETIEALRELRRAAAAAGSLARTLERNPSSILLGR